VMAGHVDHGKSTVIGRLLVETGALPQGRLEQVRETCRRNSKPFEYAFLLDALKDEQSQGITIDAARCFFRTAKRRYILIDAPGHVEFLKNMLTGASRAEAALLVIDAKEGIRENTKRHGYMLSMLGLRQVSVLVNKMDLVGYDEPTFDRIRAEYTAFLDRLGIRPVSFIPVSGMQGANIAARAPETAWFDGPTVLEQIDAFRRREFPESLPFRLPVQDVYKFTARNDDRRIVAGTIETGTIRVGDDVVFQPSGKTSTVQSIEYFNGPLKTSAAAGEAPGFTLTTQIYIRPGEWMVKAGDPPLKTATRFRANLFWMGRDPMVRGRTYKLKLGAARSPVKLVEVLAVLDATELSTVANKQQVDRHDVSECILETPKPVAFDLVSDLENTGRLVIVDHHEIAGAGIILATVESAESTLQEHIRAREIAWKSSAIPATERAQALGHGAKFVVFTGAGDGSGDACARALERALFDRGFAAYYLGMENLERGLDADLGEDARDDHIRRLGELARILTGSGLIFITSLTGADADDLRILEQLNRPNEILTVGVGGENPAGHATSLWLDLSEGIDAGVARTCDLLRDRNVILEYCI
ncbi:MAG: adenylyl-sulfate kinase, partial [Verrucomicrobia bacterium]|nr:adenylyl-sulfate kinase [Verrucomicrobiota bacterium]